jgi:hypothetical protein
MVGRDDESVRVLRSEESYAIDGAALQIKRPVHFLQKAATQRSGVESSYIVNRECDIHSLRDALEGNAVPFGKCAAQGSMSIDDCLESRSQCVCVDW